MASCDECGKRPSTKTTDEGVVIDLCPFNKMADGRAFTDYRSKCQKVTSMTTASIFHHVNLREPRVTHYSIRVHPVHHRHLRANLRRIREVLCIQLLHIRVVHRRIHSHHTRMQKRRRRQRMRMRRSILKVTAITRSRRREQLQKMKTRRCVSSPVP